MSIKRSVIEELEWALAALDGCRVVSVPTAHMRLHSVHTQTDETTYAARQLFAVRYERVLKA